MSEETPSIPFQSSVENQIQALMADENNTGVNSDEDQKPTFLMTQINQAHVNDLLDDSSTDAVSDEEPPPPQYTDEELSAFFKDFLKTKRLPPFLMRNAVIDYARQQSLKFLIAENYDEAAKLDIKISEFVTACQNDQSQFDTESKTRNVDMRVATVQEQRKQALQQWDDRIKTVQQKEQSKIDNLITRHDDEKKQFEAECQNRDFLNRFSKPSQQLLQLRQIQKQLALNHQFDEAKVVKQNAERLQMQETQQAQERAIESIRKNYKQLLERQQREIECTKLNTERKLTSLQTEKQKEEENYQKLLQQLEIRKQEYQAKKASVNVSPPTKRQVTTASKKLSEYKRAPETIQLDIKLDGIQNIFNKQKPAKLPKL